LKKTALIAGIAIVVIVIAAVALWNYHEQPQFCATCHLMEPYLESWLSPPLLAHAHAEESVACLDCHEPTIKQQVQELIVTVRQDYENPLKERDFPKAECFKCHEHGSYAQIAELTADYTVNGEQVNPHAHEIDAQAPEPEAYTGGPEDPDPHNTEKGELECDECHKVHRESPGLSVCYDCHHDALFLDCSVCHKDDEIAFSEQEFPEESCSRCHDYESTEQLIALTQDYTVDGELVNPHAYPVDPEAPEPEAYLEPEFYNPEAPNPHVTERGKLECYPCHKNIEESPLDSCYGCHHDAIFTVGCGVCHKE